MKIAMIASVVALAGAASASSATLYAWTWNAGDAGDYGVNDAAGTFESMSTSYDDASGVWTWDVTFSDQVTDGYTLAVSPGENPKGTPGELALIYFDNTAGGSPAVTVYGYNGQNSQLSWADGSPDAGIQAPDKIASTLGLGAGTILDASVVDAGGKRTFSLALDAAALDAHSPQWPGPGGDADWTGVGYGDEIGMWLHPVSWLHSDYASDGFLNDWSAETEGWFDGRRFGTVPTPGTAALMGLGGLVAARRRR